MSDKGYLKEAVLELVDKCGERELDLIWRILRGMVRKGGKQT